MGNRLQWLVWRKAILILTKNFSLLFGYVLEYERSEAIYQAGDLYLLSIRVYRRGLGCNRRCFTFPIRHRERSEAIYQA